MVFTRYEVDKVEQQLPIIANSQNPVCGSDYHSPEHRMAV